MKKYCIGLLLVLSIPGCSWFDAAPDGGITTQPRIVADEKNKRIKAIKVEGEFTVILSSDEHTTVNVEGPEAGLHNITADVQNDHMHIKMNPGTQGPFTVYVTIDKDHYSDVEDIKLMGAVTFKTQYPIGREKLDIEASGSCRIQTAVDVETLKIKGMGATKFEIDGQAIYQNIDLSGASSYHAGSLMTEKAEIEGAGSTRFMMNVSDQINGRLMGASILSYRGTPQINVLTSGAASVNKVD